MTIRQAQMKIDAWGQPHIGMIVDGGSVIYYHKNAYGWQIETIDPNLGYIGHLSLTLDHNNQPLLAYYDPTNQDLRFAGKSSDGFSFELVQYIGDVGSGCSIAVNAQNQPVISYFDQSNQVIMLATKTGQDWSFQQVAETDIYEWPTSVLEVDNQGRLHLLWGNAKTNPDYPRLSYGLFEGGQWYFTEVSSRAILGRRSLRLDANQNAAILYKKAIEGDYDEIYLQLISKTEDGLKQQDQLAIYSSNYINTDPIGIYGSDQHPVIATRQFDKYTRRDDQGVWVSKAFPFPDYLDLLDFAVDPRDSRPRFLISPWRLITMPACQPDCENKDCGDDGCGGSCGECSAGECSPNGTCSAWNFETIELGEEGFRYVDSMMVDLDQSNQAQLVFVEDEDLYHLAKQNGQWQTEQVERVDRVTLRSFELNQNGQALVALHELVNNYPYQVYLSGQDSVWETVWRGVDGTYEKEFIGLQDGSGVSHIVYAVPYYGAEKLNYSHNQSGEFQSRQIADPSDGCTDCIGTVSELDGIIKSDGSIHLVWVRTRDMFYGGIESSLRYLTNAGGTFQDSAITYRSLSSPQLAMDSNEVLYLAFYDEDDDQVEILSNSNGQWQSFTELDTYSQFELLLDHNDQPNLIQYDKLYQFDGIDSWTQIELPTPYFVSEAKYIYTSEGSLHCYYWSYLSHTPWILRHAWLNPL
jgi:hypothetical protein